MRENRFTRLKELKKLAYKRESDIYLNLYFDICQIRRFTIRIQIYDNSFTVMPRVYTPIISYIFLWS